MGNETEDNDVEGRGNTVRDGNEEKKKDNKRRK